jgi:endoglucanase
MKRTLLGFLLFAVTVYSAEAPFHRGVNLTGWLQTSGPRQIQFTKFTRQDFINIKSLGCDVIRLPINLHAMTGGAPDYTVDPLFFLFLDQIVDWAEELQIHLLLDNHTFDPALNTSDSVGDILVPVWTQMAGHYRDHSRFVYFEVLNEPHGITDKKWNEIQQRVIAAIREVDSTHTIVIGPGGWNGYSNLNLMPVYADTNLIYTFHFYDPFLFTHQGASWADPSLAPLSGVPFPYDAARMPSCPAELIGTWVQGSLANSYRTDGTVVRLRQSLDIASNFKTRRNVPLFCGEFGVYIPNSPAEDRVVWYRAVREMLEEKGIAWTIWDYTGRFGLFEAGTAERFEYDINVPLVQALGLDVPEQKAFVLEPDTAGFDLYRDYIGPNVFESSWAGDGGVIDFYSEDGPVIGRTCIAWSEAPQYTNIGFSFKPIKDLTELVGNGFAIDFWVRGDSPDARFDIRFIDTKTEDAGDHPWRMRMTIDETMASWDGQWNHLQIPLSDFTEHGSWDNGWFNPQGDFDWAAVDRFEIVSEHHAMKDMHFGFDDLRVVDPQVVAVLEPPVSAPGSPVLEQSFPNPFNSSMKIRYRLAERGRVAITVLDALGRTVRTLVACDQEPGSHAVHWDGKGDTGHRVASGVYVVRLQTAESIRLRKTVLVQ